MADLHQNNRNALRRFGLPLILLGAVLLTGTVVYWFIGGGKYSLVDTLYMTFITIATIGFGEIIPLNGNAWGRIFTMLIATSGIGVIAYTLSSITALIVEGELTQTFRRRRMERAAKQLSDHYVVCGGGEIGASLTNELRVTGRPYVVVDTIEQRGDSREEIWIRGDASDNSVLLAAGIQKAAGLFAITGDDNINLVICLSARQLNPGLRIVARCKNINNIEKLNKVGVDAVVSPNYIGGLRMASEMIRPAAVSFLDTMLRDSKSNLRVEEASVPAAFVGKPLASLGLKRFPGVLLLAVKNESDWVFNPPEDYTVKQGNILVFMTTPRERLELTHLFQNLT